MKQLPSTVLRRLKGDRHSARLGRILRGTLYVKLGLALVLGLVAGLIYLRLSAGPLSFEGLSERVAGAIASRIGPGWTVALNTSALELDEGAVALTASGLDIRNPDGLLVVRSPHAVVSLDTMSLLTGGLQARSIDFRDLQVRAAINQDGSLSFVAAEGSEPQAVSAPPAPSGASPVAPSQAGAAEAKAASAVASAVSSFFDLILEPRGVVGALDRARVTNARLTLVDSSGRERATFNRARAAFERKDAESRRFELQLDGPDGGWRIDGQLKADGAGLREGVVTATNVPGRDLILLSGQSNFPATTDVKLSVEARAAFADGRVTRLDAHLATSGGTVVVDDKDMPPIDVEAATADLVWDEARRTLLLNDVRLKSERTDIRLAGELAPGAGQGWRLAVTGRNATIRGPEPEDKPLEIETIDGVLRAGDGPMTLERLTLRGATLDLSMQGSLGTSEDPNALRVTGRATNTDVRTALRVWPNAIAHKVRNYLVQNLRHGTAELIDLTVAMSGRDIAAAIGDGPIPDESVRVDFAVAGGELRTAEGLPPLSNLAVTGRVTGTTAALAASEAQLELGEGRALLLSEGSFRLPRIWSQSAESSLSFRATGGADVLAAVLQTPLLHGIAGVELDPATIKGRSDLRVTLGLPLKKMPDLANLPIAVSGGVSGLTLDRAFGKERLENANLSIGYDRGNLNIRGEGRLLNGPVSIDIRQPRNAPGEGVLAFTLDDAARARKGMGLGKDLTGPVPVRVAVPLGKGAKSGIKVEADLSKAAVDNLVPGWVKPAGRPGKLSFLAPNTSASNGGSELREFVLDSGSAQMRGTLLLSGEGHLDRAELSSFKLSPVDDMRVVVERSGNVYRASVRGAVADARPFIRSYTGPAGTGSGSRDQREARDVDLDLAVNILTGFNDEALTNTTLKASAKNRDLRQLQMNGRLRSAAVSAQLERYERGPPILTLQSQDAGATLRFVDIYRRMHGGSLTLQVTMSDGPQRGIVTAQSFVLRDEPALKRIASTQSQGGGEDVKSNPRFDVNEVEFAKLNAEFTRTNSELKFRDAAIYGMQVGFKLSGSVDYPRDRVDVSGTFVPAYGLNNVFAQVPLFGPILGGGQNEGLFAVNFRVSGLASSPTLTVNPLSAVAPGFLRKLFGAGSPETDVTGAAPQAPPRAER